MWANGNFQVSDEQQNFLRRTEIPADLFEGGYDAATEAEELQKRFFRPIPNPWGNAGACEELSKAFGDEQWKERLTEAEPFDDGLDLKKKLEPIIEDALKKALGGHDDCFRVEKSANGTECVTVNGKVVACRSNGATFSENDLRELRSRCTCSDCRHNS